MINITKDTLREAIRNIPKTVDAAYHRILCISCLLRIERTIRWFRIYIHFDRKGDYPFPQWQLMLASYHGLEGICQRMLERGAKVEKKDELGRTPLWWAAYAGKEATVQLLLKNGADIEAKNNNGLTALHMAAQFGREAAVGLLLEYSCPIDEKDDYGNTALHWTAGSHRVSSRMATMTILLEGGADVNAVDGFGRTVLERLETMKDREDCISLCRKYQAKCQD
ncbi:ankyrin repeat-containing domain protein [Xylaria longipes]|nr:ankyrin repeat-containing domain protein [Xylaria longipes]